MFRFLLAAFVALTIFSVAASDNHRDCGEHAHYGDCVSQCPPTCLDPHRTCDTECKPGCECDENYIFSNWGICVHASTC